MNDNIKNVATYSVLPFVTLLFGYFIGNLQTEKKYKPRFEDLLSRVKYLEKGITKE